ncbi:MAG TPA: malectin domain-containing carbohydrate-binding protein, partial [Anaerolineae bacterium]|nr:malectin domain-containing carbohydrate-binding protein [Anaerolineae bacterium]
DANWSGDREFDVAIESSLVLDDLDIYTEAGQCTAYPRSFTTTVNDGQLEIDLAPYWGEAIISGIDVSFTAYPPTPTPTTGPTNTPTNTPTPTSTPVVPPDLKITDLSVPGGQPITDCWTPVDVTSDVTNASTGPCNEFFWTDLYVYTDTVGPPPPNSAGVAWQGLGSLGPNTSTTITFTHSFTISGTHYLYAQADSFQFVSEAEENNNVGGPVTVTVACEGTPPTPTPTPTPDPACGSISGTVWAFIGGQLVVPTDRVYMSLYNPSGQLIDQTLTDLAGRYTFDCVPADSGYSVRGTLDIGDTLYWGTETGIQVLPTQETANVDVILYPQ